MKHLLSFVAAMSLALGGISMVGCATNDANMPPEDRGSTAGGNGAFGESPARPGSYSGDQYNSPTTQPNNR
jgi:hypothetical protein